jgi:hypothetical protein
VKSKIIKETIMKNIKYFFLAFVLIASCHNNANAQWWINGGGDLQTDPLAAHGTFGVFINTVVDNSLTIGNNLTVTNLIYTSSLTATAALVSPSLAVMDATVTNSITSSTVTATSVVSTPSLTVTDATVSNNLTVANAIMTNSLNATSAVTTMSLTATDATISNNLNVTNAITTSTLNASSAIATLSLTTTDATISNNLSVTNAITTGTLNATTAIITPSLTATNATITNNLGVTNAITASTVNATSAIITPSLTATTATITNNLGVTNAITASTVNATGAITTPSLTATNATITNNLGVTNAITASSVNATSAITTPSLTATNATITNNLGVTNAITASTVNATSAIITPSLTVTTAITTPSITATDATITHNLRINNNTGMGMAPTATERVAVDGDIDVQNSGTAYTNIINKSVNSGINISTGTLASPKTQISMTDPGASATPGLMQFSAGNVSSPAAAFNFVLSFGGASGSIYAMQIDNKANTRIGPFGLPVVDRLTVDGDIFINSVTNTDIYRNVFAKSNFAGLHVTSGITTDGSNGACMTMNAENNFSNIMPGIGSACPGAFFVKSKAAGGNTPLGYAYQNYESGTASLHNIFLINNMGQGIFGHDINLSYISGQDVFTVKNTLGFYAPTDNFGDREIHGNSNTGSLNIYSTYSSTTGSGVECFAPGHPTFPGAIHMITKGTTGEGVVIQNYDGATWRHNVVVGNNGQTVVGHDMSLSLAAPGDVLTVKNIEGFWDPADAAYARGIHGNSTNGGVFMYSKTGYSDGSGVECWGSGSVHPGDVHFICEGSDASAGFEFDELSPTYHNYMGIFKDGVVVIAGPGGDANLISRPPGGHYGLLVGKGILTEQVRVSLQGTPDWADYVFNKDYKLMPLNKVESYVQNNNHLPGVPGAQEVVKEGIDLGKMDSKLLEKIEELTLYIIEQNKRIDELESKFGKMEAKK